MCAKAELRLRQPRATANPGHPILATCMGELALLARKKLGNASLLNKLQQASTSFPALPGPTPLLALDNLALAASHASAIDAGLDAKVAELIETAVLTHQDAETSGKLVAAAIVATLTIALDTVDDRAAHAPFAALDQRDERLRLSQRARQFNLRDPGIATRLGKQPGKLARVVSEERLCQVRASDPPIPLRSLL